MPHNAFIFLNMVLPKNTGEEKLYNKHCVGPSSKLYGLNKEVHML